MRAMGRSRGVGSPNGRSRCGELLRSRSPTSGDERRANQHREPPRADREHPHRPGQGGTRPDSARLRQLHIPPFPRNAGPIPSTVQAVTSGRSDLFVGVHALACASQRPTVATARRVLEGQRCCRDQ